MRRSPEHVTLAVPEPLEAVTERRRRVARAVVFVDEPLDASALHRLDTPSKVDVALAEFDRLPVGDADVLQMHQRHPVVEFVEQDHRVMPRGRDPPDVEFELHSLRPLDEHVERRPAIERHELVVVVVVVQRNPLFGQPCGEVREFLRRALDGFPGLEAALVEIWHDERLAVHPSVARNGLSERLRERLDGDVRAGDVEARLAECVVHFFHVAAETGELDAVITRLADAREQFGEALVEVAQRVELDGRANHTRRPVPKGKKSTMARPNPLMRALAIPSMLDVGFIGSGTVARWHADTLTSLDATLAAVADIDPDVRGSFAETYAIPERYEEYGRMLEAEDLDAVVVAVPNALHADCAVAALDAGVNVLCEKPLANTVENAECIAAAEAESAATVLVGFMRPFESHIAAAKEKIDRGELGDIYELDLEYVRRRGIPALGSWFTSERAAGGGAVIDIGVHMLHLGLHLLGFPALDAVTASTGTHFGDKEDYTHIHMWGDESQGGEFTVEDHASAFVCTADGTTVHLRCAWAANCDPVHRVRVLGDEAGTTFAADDDSLDIYSTEDGGLSDTTLRFPSLAADDALDFPNAGTFTAEWNYFADVITGEREHVRNTVEEGLAVQYLIDAIYESADTGGEVAVENP